MLRVIVVSLVLNLPITAIARGDEALSAGVAVVDITPPVGHRMAGYFSERFSTGTHDPLLAKAIVWKQGNTSAALVECDLVGVPAEITAAARELAASKSGIPKENIVVAATHSHTGPLYFGSLRNFFHQRAKEQKGADPSEAVDYRKELVSRVAEAVEKAAAAARPVTLRAGVGEETRLSFNRRFHMKDGTVRFNPGRKNPDVVRVAGPIDPDVGVLLFHEAATQKPLTSLTVFAMHLDTVGGTEYAADYPYYVERKLREKFGPEFVSLFGTGTCGDINHIDVSRDDQLKGHAEAERLGTALAETVLASLPKLEEQKTPALAVRQKAIEVPAQQFTAEETKAAAANMAKIGTRELSFLEQVETNKIVDISERYASGTVPIEVQAIRLSPDVAIVALPGEVFVELGLAIKQASPFKTTLVIELCNDVPAYIPTKKAFAEGSYEIVNSRITTGGGEKMAETAISLLKELQ